MWSSPSLSTLLVSPAVTVFTDDDLSRFQNVWAPALYEANGRWYIYYTADDGTDANHRNYVIESEGSDPAGPYHFKAKIADHGEFAIDGEPVMIDGQRYFSWSGPGTDGAPRPNQIYLQKMDTPWSVTGERIAVPVPNGSCDDIREGPTGLEHHGRVYLTYSSCPTALPDYSVWTVSIANGADPMVASNWKSHDRPILERNDAAGVYGPGLHSFFHSPDGAETWIAYHAKNTSDTTYSFRTTRAQKVTFPADDYPYVKPVQTGSTLDLPSGDPGTGAPTYLNDTKMTFSGTGWHSGDGCGVECFRGDDHWSWTKGDTATFEFTGTQVVLLSVKDPFNGKAEITIDGEHARTVNFYGNPRVGEGVQYISPTLPRGKHTVTVRVLGERGAPSTVPEGGATVSFDRAEIYP
ncbi:hydrolase [Parenemella sanctibonifatiensis]|uniref:Hydrolase n=2 Tax=Parenemella sanctibonifatiensis TaxID=2016505 RepID=A0A255E294_9ACTN|nr:hydrolase [Parenemella sanctibonifatiensis]